MKIQKYDYITTEKEYFPFAFQTLCTQNTELQTTKKTTILFGNILRLFFIVSVF